MVIELPFLNIKKGGAVAQMRKQLVFMSIILAVFFLNSCAAVGFITGGVTLTCVAYEDVSKERCPPLVEIDEQLKN